MAVSQRLTLEEFLRLPEEKPALELMHGLVRKKVSPKTRHSTLQAKSVELINRFAEPARLAFAFPELRTTFAGASVVPDVSVLRWDRIPRDAAGELVDDVVEPSDIAIEIASAEQSARELADRCDWYVRNAVPVALLVRSNARSVTVFRPGATPVELRGSDPIDIDDILAGFDLTVQDLFDAASLR